MYWNPSEMKRKNAVKISRARRVESQRSTQTRAMRTRKMFARAKVARMSVDQRARDGFARLMPMSAAMRESVPMTADALRSPKKMRAVRYRGKLRGKRMMVLMSKLRPGGEMLRTTSIHRAKMAHVSNGSIAMRPVETR